MIQIIKITQIAVSIILITLVIIQNKGTGLSSAFGGNSGFYRSRRGVEKTIFIATIVFGLLLVINSLLLLFLD